VRGEPSGTTTNTESIYEFTKSYLIPHNLSGDCLAVAGKPALSLPKGQRFKIFSPPIYWGLFSCRRHGDVLKYLAPQFIGGFFSCVLHRVLFYPNLLLVLIRPCNYRVLLCPQIFIFSRRAKLGQFHEKKILVLHTLIMVLFCVLKIFKPELRTKFFGRIKKWPIL